MAPSIRDLFQESSELWRMLFENMHEALLIADADAGIIVDANKQAEILFDRAREEIIGMHQRQLHPPEKQDLYAAYFEGDSRGETTSPKTGFIVTKAGKKVPVEILATKVSKDGHTFLIGLFRDITNRRRARRALLASEAKFRSVVEQASDGILLLDHGGIIIEWNRSMEQMIGLTKLEVMGIPIWEIHFRITPDELRKDTRVEDLKQLEESFLRDLDSQNQSKGCERLIQRPDGGHRVVQESIFPIFIGKKKITCGILHDVTKRRETEDLLKQSTEDALQLSQLKTNLLTYASHELKTPLIPILGWSEFIKKALEQGKPLPESVSKEAIDSIFHSAERLLQLINGFLDLGRIEKKSLDLQKQPTKLSSLVKSAIASVGYQALSAHITIHEVLQDCMVSVDSLRLEQVFINILSNALKYSPHDTDIWVKSSCSDKKVHIAITDQGYGFTRDELKNIWHLFSNVANFKTNETISGTGIGLYLSKSIIELHGGTIEIVSPGQNQGSTVLITLPLDFK